MCISVSFYLLLLFYFIICTRKCFALAVAAISVELRAILLYKICNILHFSVAWLILRTTANSVQHSARAESEL